VLAFSYFSFEQIKFIKLLKIVNSKKFMFIIVNHLEIINARLFRLTVIQSREGTEGLAEKGYNLREEAQG
jgi:hypothetical protein